MRNSERMNEFGELENVARDKSNESIYNLKPFIRLEIIKEEFGANKCEGNAKEKMMRSQIENKKRRITMKFNHDKKKNNEVW